MIGDVVIKKGLFYNILLVIANATLAIAFGMSNNVGFAMFWSFLTGIYSARLLHQYV